MNRFFPLLFVALLVVSCGSKNSPTTPSGSSNGSSGFTFNGPLVVSEIQSGIVSTGIVTSNGPVTNAAVTLSYSGSTATLSYLSNYSYPVTYSGSVTMISMGYYANSAFTYTAGQPYTITAAFEGNTYSASTTAVGSPVFTTSGSDLVCTWVGGGNDNVITAEESISPYTTKTFGPNLTSPYSIPNSSLPGATGQNIILAAIVNLNTSVFSGATSGSYFLSTSEASTVY